MTARPLDCRSKAGETVGMIDAAIHALRAASRGNLRHPAVVEALRDFACDAEVRRVLDTARQENEKAEADKLLQVPPPRGGGRIVWHGELSRWHGVADAVHALLWLMFIVAVICALVAW